MEEYEEKGMKTLDLHGVRHHRVDRLVENFVLLNDMPVRIITGNSTVMRELTFAVLERHEFSADTENHWNLGSLIVRDS